MKRMKRLRAQEAIAEQQPLASVEQTEDSDRRL